MLEMTGITKRFAGVTALADVHLSVGSGEVVALVGENGAGKSTLMKILAGVYVPEAGTIRLHDQPVSIRSARDAAHHGVGIIYQELEVIDALDVAGNVFLGREPTWAGPLKLLDRTRISADTRTWLARVGLDVSPATLLASLSTAQQQLVEIARALSQNARVLIMDEPTSSLTMSETERLIHVVKDLKAAGVSVIYVSHRLGEIERLADRVVVLRDGKNAGELHGGEITRDRMVRLMAGRDLELARTGSSASPGEARLEVRGLKTRRYPAHEVSFSVRRGEILGIAGLIGAGRSELAQAIFAIEPARSGTISIDGHPVTLRSPRDAIRKGVYLVPEDRRESGLVTAMAVRENITLPDLSPYARVGWIRQKAEAAGASASCERFAIKTPSIETSVSHLSGGNQQKIVLARWLSLSPKVMILDEPTRGIDVGAKAEIHQLIRRLAASGVAVLMISSEMEEILANCDRVAVMHEGRVTGILERSDCTQEAIMRLAVA